MRDSLLNDLRADLNYVARTARRSPTFTIVAIVSIALQGGSRRRGKRDVRTQILGTREAVGRHFRYGRSGPPVEVIGIVQDGKYESLSESARAVVFRPILQFYNSTTTVLVRSAVPPGQMVAAMRRAIADLDTQLPLYGAGTLKEMLGFVLFPSRAAAIALSAFGLFAIALAGTGVHGLVAYAVARREREIGIRLAVGASRMDVLRLVLSRVAVLLSLGGIIGIALALAARRLLASVVFQASASEPGLPVGVVAIIVGIGMISCWFPAHRAVRVDPAGALRTQ